MTLYIAIFVLIASALTLLGLYADFKKTGNTEVGAIMVGSAFVAAYLTALIWAFITIIHAL